ncbi:MAG: class I SAM-dependent methyltransferase [Candidatus Hydrogenedentota bacterium]|nr:MAG: class I SAM-dependent methyltransferase [Candidatus Hydrogenedentota bacterium]
MPRPKQGSVGKAEDGHRAAGRFYDELADGYELMIDWDARLKREAPFFRKLFAEHRVKKVLDCACGTGRHALEFARWGKEVFACDISPQMLRLAERNASAARVNVDFFKAGMTEVAKRAGPERFDAVVCLGNSLPHLLTQRELDRSMRSIKNALAPGGIFVAQIRNYERILRENLRFMPPTSAESEDGETIFFRMLDIHGPRAVDFHIIRFLRERDQWRYRIQTTRLRPIVKKHMDAALKRAGFQRIRYYADYSFTPFASSKTLDLIVVAR